MPKHIIIRDDDTSFFSTVDMLEKVYGRLWENNIPVCLAVIPAHNGNTHVTHRQGNPFDPSIPPSYRGIDKDQSVTNNLPVCNFLNERIQDGLVEVCLHGYNHAYHEYATTDRELIAHKLRRGHELLENAFPNTPISTFVAPYDKLSAEAMSLLLAAGYDIATDPGNLAHLNNGLGTKNHFAHFELENGRRIFTADQYLFNYRDDADECLNRALKSLADDDFIVIVNHYWMFFYDWNKPTTLMDNWHHFLDQLLALPDVTFSRFADS